MLHRSLRPAKVGVAHFDDAPGTIESGIDLDLLVARARTFQRHNGVAARVEKYAEEIIRFGVDPDAGHDIFDPDNLAIVDIERVCD
jgi:hypothetical protein